MDNNIDFSLDNLSVASPCSANWDEMVGTDQVRFCGQCQLNVYHLSMMTLPEAQKIVAEKEGGRLCVRFFKRSDGTLITQDCPVGLQQLHARKLKLVSTGNRIWQKRSWAAAVLCVTVVGLYTVSSVSAESKKQSPSVSPTPQQHMTSAVGTDSHHAKPPVEKSNDIEMGEIDVNRVEMGKPKMNAPSDLPQNKLPLPKSGKASPKPAHRPKPEPLMGKISPNSNLSPQK
jgi:hypothetical protein